MLSIHLRLGLPSGLFPSGFHTNNLYTFLFSPIHEASNTDINSQDKDVLEAEVQVLRHSFEATLKQFTSVNAAVGLWWRN
jgi:hypothetical protein